MGRVYILVCLTILHYAIYGQVVDRYPYIQSPNENSAIIAWNNATAGIGMVKWGITSNALNDSVGESSANQVHGLTITGLQPNTRYYYQASCGAFQSSIEYFYTAKPSTVRNLDFVVYGDCGFNSSQQDSIAAHMSTYPVDFGLVVGDVDQYLGADYDVDYFQHYTNMMKNVCHFTAEGNHDTLTNQTNYVGQFFLPHNNPDSSELYYSFTWGNAKFIALDGNIDYSIGSAQYNWLQSELMCNDHEWVFAFFHQPPWTNAWDVSYYIPFTGFYMYQGNADMRTSIVPLFEQYHVDFVLNGHAHDYQRGSYNGVNYFIAGGGGTSTPDTHTNSSSPNINFEQDVNNFMKFSINGDTVKYYALGLNGAAIDSGIFTKNYTPFSASISATNVACNSVANGQAIIQVTGPRPLYAVLWSNGSVSDTISQLSSGTYYVSITDTNGCVSYDSATIQQTDPVVITAVANSATCAGDDNGSISGLTITGGTPPYNYTWTNATEIDSLLPGIYIIQATDSNGCSVTQSFNIQTLGGNIRPSVSAAGNQNVICLGDSLLLTGSAGFSNYHWNNGQNVSSIYAYTAGQYYLTATDNFGCMVYSDSLNLNSDSVSHLQISAAALGLTVNVGASQNGLSSYTWNFGNGITLADTTSSLAYTYQDTGSYTIQLITQQFCGNDTTSIVIHLAGDTGTSILFLSGEQLHLTLSPNPFHESTNLNISGSKSGEYNLLLYSADGKLAGNLGKMKNGNIIINRTGLAAGEYLLQVLGANSKATLKLVVQ